MNHYPNEVLTIRVYDQKARGCKLIQPENHGFLWSESVRENVGKKMLQTSFQWNL